MASVILFCVKNQFINYFNQLYGFIDFLKADKNITSSVTMTFAIRPAKIL